MRLRVFLPDEILLTRDVERVVVDTLDGSRGLLPRHIDFVTLLDSGILEYTLEGGDVEYAAVDGGVLVKAGDEIRVSTRDAVLGPGLERLQEAVRERFSRRTEHESAVSKALDRLEVHVMQKFMEMREFRTGRRGV
jgi:F-type H+-transporting ATPase subunit epsilon